MCLHQTRSEGRHSLQVVASVTWSKLANLEDCDRLQLQGFLPGLRNGKFSVKFCVFQFFVFQEICVGMQENFQRFSLPIVQVLQVFLGLLCYSFSVKINN